jgi:hypothetical protein
VWSGEELQLKEWKFGIERALKIFKRVVEVDMQFHVV